MKSGTTVGISYDCDDIYFELVDVSHGGNYTIHTSEHYELLEGLWELAKQVVEQEVSWEHFTPCD